MCTIGVRKRVFFIPENIEASARLFFLVSDGDRKRKRGKLILRTRERCTTRLGGIDIFFQAKARDMQQTQQIMHSGVYRSNITPLPETRSGFP